MKKQKLLIILIALFLPFFNISAQVLENIPGQSSTGSSNLIGYLNNLYKFGISITGILAVFMIALGAFSYIVTSAGNSSKKMNAKEMINNALIGLVIVLTAYLFLYVINPDLVSGTLKAPEEAIKNAVSTTNIGENINRNLLDGTPCDDGSESSSCPGCPSCSNCKSCDTYSDATPDCYWLKDGETVCGVDPAIVASREAVSTDIGCCEYNLTNFFGKNCQSNITKNECESRSGGNIFYLGVNYSCVDASGFGTGDKCVLNESILPTLPALPNPSDLP